MARTIKIEQAPSGAVRFIKGGVIQKSLPRCASKKIVRDEEIEVKDSSLTSFSFNINDLFSVQLDGSPATLITTQTRNKIMILLDDFFF